jgi:hypothetical protein
VGSLELDDPAEGDRSAVLAVAAAIVTLPLLEPNGPGRFAPADLVMGAAIVATLVWVGTHRVRIRFPYLVSMGLMIVAGFASSAFSPDMGTSALALVQDTFLLAFGIAVANAIRSPRDLSIVLAVWSWAATAWATLLVAATLANVSIPFATTGAESRAALWFDEPNMAGQYFALSFFVLLLSRRPTNPAVRACAGLVMLLAVLLTGSNGALLSLLAGGGAALFVAMWRRTDLLVAAAGGVLVLSLVGGLVLLAVNGGVVEDLRESGNPLVERSLARSPRSAEGRTSLFQTELELFRTATPLGRGPASIREALEESFGLSKSGHSDYLATLVERGVIGVIGLLLLIGSVGVMTYSVVFRPLLPGFSRQLRHPAALVGAFLAHALYAIPHETLHYRYLWALLGIVASLYLFGREAQRVPEIGGSARAPGTHQLV